MTGFFLNQHPLSETTANPRIAALMISLSLMLDSPLVELAIVAEK